jgi:hypothetical protein
LSAWELLGEEFEREAHSLGVPSWYNCDKMYSPHTSNLQPLRNSQMRISIWSGLTRSKSKTIYQIALLRSFLMCSPLLNSPLFTKLVVAWSIWLALKQSYMTAAPIVACVILDLTKLLITAFTARSLA